MTDEMVVDIVSNTLDASYDVWEDPGDYPCNAGSSPLSSYAYVEEIEGSVDIHLESFPREWFLDSVSEVGVSEWGSYNDLYRAAVLHLLDLWLDDEGGDLIDRPEGVSGLEWEITLDADGAHATLRVENFVAHSLSMHRRSLYD